jgi:Tol biopolymer transport system component
MYAAPGYLLFLRERTLMAQPFDAGRGESTGDAVPVAEQVYHQEGTTAGSFAISQNGVLTYISSGGEVNTQLSWFDRTGKQLGKVGQPGVYFGLRLAPDEKRVAFYRPVAQSRAASDIWVMDLVRDVTSRLTFDPGLNNEPIWSPDGLRILYANSRSGSYDFYSKAASGAGQEDMLVQFGSPNGWATSWSRDGRFVLGTQQFPGSKTGFDLWIAPQFGDRKPFPYLQTQFNEGDGAFSPDGRWVAYMSDESGRNEIYVQAFPLSGAKFQISTGGGAEPLWRGDGAELFYRSADGSLMEAPVKPGATFEVGVPKSLFSAPRQAQGIYRYDYAVTDDGQRFLIAADEEGDCGRTNAPVVNSRYRKASGRSAPSRLLSIL